MTERWPSTGALLARRYRLLARIETGGMAVVWRARDELLGRNVALKLLSDRYADNGLHHLVHREARAAARLSHPHVAAVHDYAEAIAPDGAVRPFVVMELLGGESLAARLTLGPLPWPEAAAIGRATADALAAAHEQGVVHRDVTPGNIMLTPGGVKILDFGISAAIGEPDEDVTGVTFGTPAYVAPERLDGLPARAATDVYGLGVLLYEMLTGAPPHPAQTWEELSAARATAPAPLPPGTPDALAEVIRRCLAEDPDDRPTALEVVDILGDVIASAAGSGATVPGEAFSAAAATAAGSFPVPAPPGVSAATKPATWTTVDLAEPTAAPGSRRRVAVAAALVVAVMAVVLGVLLDHERSASGVAGPATPPAATAPSDTSPDSPAPPTGSATPDRSATPALAEAVARLRRTVEDGRASGGIRPDVVQDLLNIINQFDDRAVAADRVGTLQRKVDERAREGAVSRTYAALLRSDLNDVAAATAVAA